MQFLAIVLWKQLLIFSYRDNIRWKESKLREILPSHRGNLLSPLRRVCLGLKREGAVKCELWFPGQQAQKQACSKPTILEAALTHGNWEKWVCRGATFSQLSPYHFSTLVCKHYRPLTGHPVLSLGCSDIQQFHHAVTQNHHFWAMLSSLAQGR